MPEVGPVISLVAPVITEVSCRAAISRDSFSRAAPEIAGVSVQREPSVGVNRRDLGVGLACGVYPRGFRGGNGVLAGDIQGMNGR